ncbi:hypothetical protein VTI74DRAFT_2825 [Chaetomium olivicolor]
MGRGVFKGRRCNNRNKGDSGAKARPDGWSSICTPRLPPRCRRVWMGWACGSAITDLIPFLLVPLPSFTPRLPEIVDELSPGWQSPWHVCKQEQGVNITFEVEFASNFGAVFPCVDPVFPVFVFGYCGGGGGGWYGYTDLDSPELPCRGESIAGLGFGPWLLD